MPKQKYDVIDDSLCAWPAPQPLGNDLPPVAAFDLAFMPASFQRLIEDVSERMQTPPDYAGASVIVALAGCVNRRVMVQPREYDESWRKPCNLWGGIVGPPGFLKSPVLMTVTRPLAQIEEAWRAKHDEELTTYELAREQAELALQNWRGLSKAAMNKGIPPPLRPDTSTKPPTQKRLILQDATFEKLHEILAENPAGVLVLRDELTGWLSELDRQGREGERAFYLTAWNGDSGHSIDRIGRGSIYVPHVCVSLFGGIQPARLRSYLVDALKDGPANDGLAQRFQVLVWPDPPKEWNLVDRAPNLKAVEQARSVFESLAKMEASAHNQNVLKFSPDAQRLFNDWVSELEPLVRSEQLHPALLAHLGKYRSLMPVLAALFELADWAAGLGGGGVISLTHARQAAALCEFLQSHARRVYGCIVSPELHAARELAERIRQGKIPTEFSTRDVYLKGWSGLGTPDEARAALRVLEDCGWIRRAGGEEGGGRPSERWQINPRIKEVGK